MCLRKKIGGKLRLSTFISSLSKQSIFVDAHFPSAVYEKNAFPMINNHPVYTYLKLTLHACKGSNLINRKENSNQKINKQQQKH